MAIGTKKLLDLMSENYPKAQNPLILRFHRLIDAFAKSDDERDFYLDKVEGFMVFVDLDKNTEDLEKLVTEIEKNISRYCLLPKMTYYETKKFMEGFVNEKVYDIDTKEKLLDIIQSREARENFLEFIYDHLTELEKWQQYYHERSRIRVIEWLRDNNIAFVFEEDIDIVKPVVEKLKQSIFEPKVGKDIQSARNQLEAKAKTYYSNEALNPRPKRGRPPKQTAKVELEPQLTPDIFQTVPSPCRAFLFMPDYSSSAATFSSKFDTEAQLIASLRGTTRAKVDTKLEALSQRLESLRHLSDRLRGVDDLGREKRMIEAVSETSSRISDKSVKRDDEDGGKISSFISGFLPKKKSAVPKQPEEIQEYLEKKKKAGKKMVTPITRKKKGNK